LFFCWWLGHRRDLLSFPTRRSSDLGLDVLLAGQSPLGEVLASPSAIELKGIAACLLDVDDRLRRQRLERRDPGKWDVDAQRSFVDREEHTSELQSRGHLVCRLLLEK